MTAAALAIGLLAGLAAAAVLLRTWESGHAGRLLEGWRAEATEELMRTAQRHSEAVVRGQVAEQTAPLTLSFPWPPEDARFLGKPVDYVVFDGLAEVRRGELDRLREIVFVDVKTGGAGLTRSERRVRRCVEAGRVDAAVGPAVGPAVLGGEGVGP
jgi:predicted Holliday junction resolvase-like endonuclease